jgi:hypothetical protein
MAGQRQLLHPPAQKLSATTAAAKWNAFTRDPLLMQYHSRGFAMPLGPKSQPRVGIQQSIVRARRLDFRILLSKGIFR